MLTGQVLGQVDGVGADVAQGPGTGPLLVQPPGQRDRDIGQPVLQVGGADVPQAADPAVVDQPPGQRDGRDPAVVEPDHGPHAALGGPGGRRGHGLGFGQRVAQRLLAQHVLARVQRGDGDLGVGVAGGADVHQLHVVPVDQGPPVGLDVVPAVTAGGEPGGGLVPAGQHVHPGPERDVERLAHGGPGPGVGRAHEGVAHHPDAQNWRVRLARACGHTDPTPREAAAAPRKPNLPARTPPPPGTPAPPPSPPARARPAAPVARCGTPVRRRAGQVEHAQAAPGRRRPPTGSSPSAALMVPAVDLDVAVEPVRVRHAPSCPRCR